MMRRNGSWKSFRLKAKPGSCSIRCPIEVPAVSVVELGIIRELVMPRRRHHRGGDADLLGLPGDRGDGLAIRDTLRWRRGTAGSSSDPALDPLQMDQRLDRRGGAREAAAYGIVAAYRPRCSGWGAADPLRQAGAELPALRLQGYRTPVGIRLHRLQGHLSLQELP